MERTKGLFTTVDQINALDLSDPNNQRWRIPLWVDMPETIKMKRPENELVLLDMLNSPAMSVTVKDMDQPVIRWSVDEALDLWTKVNTAATFVGQTSVAIYVDDTYVVRQGNGVFFPETNQFHIITAVNDTAGTVTVNLQYTGSEVANLSVGDTMLVLPPYVGEEGKAWDTTSVLPGEPQFNYIAIAAHKWGASKMQANANMDGGFVTLDDERMRQVFRMRQMVQNALMFQNRATWHDATYGQYYIGGSLLSQISTHQMDASGVGDTLTFGNLNDFLEGTFESANSSTHKIAPCGRGLWANLLKTARDAGALNLIQGNETYMHPDLGAMSFEVRTLEGYTVEFIRLRGSLVESVANWGFVVDPANIGRGQYKGLGPQIFNDIQGNDEILITEQAYLESFSINVIDESTCGVLKGGTKPLII